MTVRNWHEAIGHLRAIREPGVLVTVAAVRGHAPRAAGAKLVVGATTMWGTIGGGNAEAVAVDRARALLGSDVDGPELMTIPLSDKVPVAHGVQCCGGELTLLFEPLPVVPVVAIFGAGHVGLELARILARHDIGLHLVDSRAEQLAPDRLGVLADAVADVRVHHAPLLPETVLRELPPGTHVVIMTHDHAEDVALCDAALRDGDYGSIGLIGSAGKWVRFQRRLADLGHDPATIGRITTPIGLPEITGKEPATIAVSVAAALLQAFAADRHRTRPTASRPTTKEAEPPVPAE